MDDVSALPLHKIASVPEHAVEHFKSLISEIKELSVMTDHAKFEEVAISKDRITATDLALWKVIMSNLPTTGPGGVSGTEALASAGLGSSPPPSRA
jgi:tellurite resistance-related uncharacterized protein